MMNEVDSTNRTQQLASMWELHTKAQRAAARARAAFMACDDAHYDAAFAAMDRAIARSESIRKSAQALEAQLMAVR